MMYVDSMKCMYLSQQVILASQTLTYRNVNNESVTNISVHVCTRYMHVYTNLYIHVYTYTYTYEQCTYMFILAYVCTMYVHGAYMYVQHHNYMYMYIRFRKFMYMSEGAT